MANPVATFEEIRVSAGLWSLGTRRSGINETAEAWRTLAESAGTRADSLRDGTRTLLASDWAGDARDSFDEHLRKVVRDLDQVKTQSDELARHADGIYDLANSYQEFLNQALLAIMGSVPSSVDGDVFVFAPRTAGEVEAVRAAVDGANELRTEFDDALASYPAKFSADEWTSISDRWDSIVTGTADPFELPPEADGTSVLWIDGEVVVNTGTGDDVVNVTVDPDTGQVIVEVNGVEHRYPPDTPITVRSGEGDDVIEVAEGVGVDLVLLGGEDQDQIRGGGGSETILGGRGRDELYGGDGSDYLSGGSGMDYVEGQGGGDRISGGQGKDVLYGLGSDNYIAGGEGDDYVEGGKGDDTVHGGAGDDVVSGGRGDDTVHGGGGHDVIYGGHGRDTVDGGSGVDRAYTQAEDRVDRAAGITIEVTSDAGFINIEGSPEFVERVTADLDMMQASPTGQQMLAELRDMRDPSSWPGEHSLTIREGDSGNSANRGGGSVIGGNRDSGIEYNPSNLRPNSGGRPPTIGLYHEMGHVYSYWKGNYNSDPVVGGPDDGIKIAERQATGLPIDHDGDASTPDRIDPEQPLVFTENGLRTEMGLDTRDSYRS